MKVKFIKSPGRFNLAYFEGDEAEFSTERAEELIATGYAILTKEGKEEAEIELMIQDATIETPEKNKRKKK
jgi:hypothetical protein